ncbi:sialate:O-sulfotransferase 1-like [Argopecten irradians]|uniref:sialate:O-sulfotransferase 1-like n=1 Tax=Argopecten irradians TaxID=31199 RepID=UPI0037214AED
MIYVSAALIKQVGSGLDISVMNTKTRYLFGVILCMFGIGFLCIRHAKYQFNVHDIEFKITYNRKNPELLPKELESCPLRNVSIMKKKEKFIHVGLLSYPGSGNTWTRHMIQQLTGYCTGTVYCDRFLAKKGFPGECVFPSTKAKGCIIYKSHYNVKDKLRGFQKAIILIRNPFDALKAFFNWHTGKQSQYSVNAAVLQKNNKTRIIKDRFHALVDPSKFNSTAWSAHVKRESTVWRDSYLTWLNVFQNRSLVVRYKDLRENLIPTLRKISKFLNVQSTEMDYICTDVNKEGQHHRKQTYSLETADIFTDQQIDMVNSAIMTVMNATKNRYSLKDFIFVNP